MKAARAAIARFPSAADALLRNPSRAAWLCARFGISPGQLINGVPAMEAEGGEDLRTRGGPPLDWLAEVRAREWATSPPTSLDP